MYIILLTLVIGGNYFQSFFGIYYKLASKIISYIIIVVAKKL